MAGIFALALLVRLSLLAVGSPAESTPPYRLLSGDPLDILLDGVIADRLRGACIPVYFADPNCPGCQALAAKWQRAVRRRGVWILDGSLQDSRQFAAVFDIPEDSMLNLSAIAGRSITLDEVGVLATPTSSVLSKDRRLLKVRVNTELRSGAEIPQCLGLER